MPDSLRKVLLGTLIGALVVGFAWHIAGERAKRAPASMSAAPGAAATGGKPGARCGHARRRGRVAAPSSPSWRHRRAPSNSHSKSRHSAPHAPASPSTSRPRCPTSSPRSGSPKASRFARATCSSNSTARRHVPTSRWPKPRSRKARASCSAAASCTRRKFSPTSRSSRSSRPTRRTWRESPRRAHASATRSFARRSMAGSACAAPASAGWWRRARSSPRSTTPARSSSISPCPSVSWRR